MKIIMVMVQSVDGKISPEENQSSYLWNSREDRQYFEQITRRCKAVIMGRKTFQTLNRPLSDRFTTVMTRTPEKYRNIEDSIDFTKGPLEEVIKKLQNRGFTEAVLAGGSMTNSSFLSKGLVDELHLTVEGILFGRGPGICDGITDRADLEILNIKQFSPKSILIGYKILNKL